MTISMTGPSAVNSHDGSEGPLSSRRDWHSVKRPSIDASVAAEIEINLWLHVAIQKDDPLSSASNRSRRPGHLAAGFEPERLDHECAGLPVVLRVDAADQGVALRQGADVVAVFALGRRFEAATANSLGVSSDQSPQTDVLAGRGHEQ